MTDFQILRRDIYDLHDKGSLNLRDGFTEENKPIVFESQRKIEEKVEVTDSSGFNMSVAVLKDIIRVNQRVNTNNSNDNALEDTTATIKHGEIITIAIRLENLQDVTCITVIYWSTRIMR